MYKQSIITKNDTCCLISKEIHPAETIPYLGYCWKRNIILLINNNPANPNIPNQNFFFVFLSIIKSVSMIRLHIERKIPIGKTLVNLLNSLSAINGWIPSKPVVGFPIKLSPNKRKNHNGTSERAVPTNKISPRTFLFSYLLIFFKNNQNEIMSPSRMPIKWKLYHCGVISLNRSSFQWGIIPTFNAKSI